MDPNPTDLATPPGQRLQSLSVPTSVTAVNSASSSSSRVITFPYPATTGDSSSFLNKSSSFSPPFTRTPYKKSPGESPVRRSGYTRLRRLANRGVLRWLLVLLAVLLSAHVFLSICCSSARDDLFFLSSYLPKEWVSPGFQLPGGGAGKNNHKPRQWLEENSYPNDLRADRPNAALISLVRNQELEGILQSMRQLEFRWNRRYQYPWVFFNEKPFSDEFKAATSNATSARTEYHQVPRAHWNTPPHINMTLYYNSLDYLSMASVGKGHLLSYHSMIRWQSGFFYLHPALAAYDYYWRVEPDVHFFCDIPYDPFRFMHATGMVYGFNMAILDDARSFASLWSTTRDFIAAHPDLVHPDARLDWLLDPQTGLTYNNCQFFSNFEIGSLGFFRDNPGNRRYFDWLERQGGFYYSRWGDAPVHTLSVTMFAPPERLWWFRDIGYQHDIARHCPPQGPSASTAEGGESTEESEEEEEESLASLSTRFWLPGSGLEKTTRRPRPRPRPPCTCEPTSLDENFYKLVPMESPQRKPADTCIRLWLGGKWLRKKAGWSQETERMLGGDGYGGYVFDGM
ncbi:hypothetical protein AYL99_06018 [Fonsecaea erecta]|uniref:Mannosyltransferase n=1 Tax=Fonsecaea erecta TaxID=1367422 RepID=A0A178ZMH2_9EURO|nr:hypothetical protein AYL99_06018 [Fonsecaea erecta]OAP61014.1 hypothetical protein AYL99_06018 [Fonsecaea erecta]